MKLSDVEDTLKYVRHKLDIKRIDIFFMRQQAQDTYTRLETLQRVLPKANKIYWECRIEQEKAQVDKVMELHEELLGKTVVLVDRLKEVMALDGPEAWLRETRKAIVEYYEDSRDRVG